jgi:hypothetical protein
MRLAQLARKLSLKPGEIQEFLRQRNQTVELNPNTRLTDEQVMMAVRHFDPSMEATMKQEPPAHEVAEPVDEIVETPETLVETPLDDFQRTAEPTEQTGAEVPYPEETGTTTEAEVIRAPKLELPGLRVIGKIELKETKKKETPAALSEGTEPRSERPLRPANRERQQRQWKNPLEQQRQREAQEREEKRAREIEADKLRRTQKYLNKVKSVPTKRVRRDEEAESEVVEDVRPVPRTWLGRLARWLTT